MVLRRMLRPWTQARSPCSSSVLHELIREAAQAKAAESWGKKRMGVAQLTPLGGFFF